MNLPFMKFYVRDWQGDIGLKMCSLESRGLWIEMLFIMHSAKRRGYLETEQGHPLDDDQTSRLIGTFKGDLYRCKQELLLHGVPSVEDGTGVWYCRRMVKETAKAEKCSAAAIKGGGNPVLNKEIKNTDTRIPETRDHISLKVTFKGGDKGMSARMISDIESVLNCRPEFQRLKPESIATEIRNASENPRWEKNLQEFLADASNSIDCPKNPLGMMRAYLNRLESQSPNRSKRRTVRFE